MCYHQLTPIIQVEGMDSSPSTQSEVLEESSKEEVGADDIVVDPKKVVCIECRLEVQGQVSKLL